LQPSIRRRAGVVTRAALFRSKGDNDSGAQSRESPLDPGSL